MKKCNVMLIGGHGYIGSHVAIQLANRKIPTVIIDDNSNSDGDSVKASLKSILRENDKYIVSRKFCVENTWRAVNQLQNLMVKYEITHVIHLAGLKSVPDSVERPITYLDYNTNLLLAVLNAMKLSGVKNIVFSSTAAVYGMGGEGLGESSPIECLNAYAESKYLQERILRRLASDSKIKYTILRYFNPIGNDPSGLIGENPPAKPNNVLPFMLRCVGTDSKFTVFGNDYDTLDGTGVRDYIDVCDLADAHVKVVESGALKNRTYNVGYGKGTSVLELLNEVKKVIGDQKLEWEFRPRRKGDIPICTACPDKFISEFKWNPKSNISKAIESQWKWELNRRSQHPLRGG